MTQMEVLQRMYDSTTDEGTRRSIKESMGKLTEMGTEGAKCACKEESEYQKYQRQWQDGQGKQGSTPQPIRSDMFAANFMGDTAFVAIPTAEAVEDEYRPRHCGPRDYFQGDKELRKLAQSENLLATTSVLGGTVCNDGFIFNPYIHRTMMPLKVCTIGSEVWNITGGLSAQDYIRGVMLTLSGYTWGLQYVWGEKPNESYCAMVMEKLKAAIAKGHGKQIERYTRTLWRRSGLMYTVQKLVFNTQRELQVLQNMADHESPEFIQIRYGTGYEEAKDRLTRNLDSLLRMFYSPFIADDICDKITADIVTKEMRESGGKPYFDKWTIKRELRKIDFDQVSERILYGVETSELPGTQDYVDMGVRGTMYSVALFPERYAEFLGGDLGITLEDTQADIQTQTERLCSAMTELFSKVPPEVRDQRSRFF